MKDSLIMSEELFFNEEKHEYTNKEGLRYESVTQFLGHFYNHFEDQEQFWLIYKSLQYLSDIDKPVKIKKYNSELNDLIGNVIFSESEYKQYQRYGLSQCNKDDKLFINVFSYREQDEIERVCKLIKNSWTEGNKKSTRKGSAFHLAKEDKQFKDKLFNFNGKEYPVIPQHSTIDWYNLEPGTHVELKLILPEFRLAGTADQVIVQENKGIIIRDHKSNLEIKTSNKYQNMLHCCSHLEDCNANHYYLQLSMYMYMLEQFGYSHSYMEFEHFELEEVGDEIYREVNNTIYPVPYMRDTIVKMLQWYSENILNK
jgi:hypothetical protein